MTEFIISYDENFNKIHISTKDTIIVNVTIIGDDKSIYSTTSNFNGFPFWYQPTEDLSKFKSLRVDIKDKDDHLLKSETIGFFAEFLTDKYIRENYFPDYSFKGTMIELGAGPPVFYSMSKHFRDNGWRCICIDPNPKFIQQHKDLGNEIYQYACSDEDKDSIFSVANCNMWNEKNEGISASSLSIKYELKGNEKITEIPVKVIKLNTLLTELNINHIDFISVDTEGWELEVMRGFDTLKYNPKVVILENFDHNSTYTAYMQSLGYYLNHKIEYNYIYTKYNKSLNYYGQGLEDQVIEKYFPEGFIGGCIDIGATDGIHNNNTLHFDESGWYSMCIEPNPQYYKQLVYNRKNTLKLAISNYNKDGDVFHVVNLDNANEEAVSSLKIDKRLLNDHSSHEIIIRDEICDVRTLDYCVENHYKYDTIDFISIDTEGTELDVLKGFDINKWQPKLFIVENVYNEPEIEEYMKTFGYVKDHRMNVNDFYIKKIIRSMDTFGNLIDKLTITNLKIWKFEDVKRDSNDDKEIADATRKTNVLNQQRTDLIQEIDEMLINASKGNIFFKNYEQGSTKSYGK